MFGDALSWYLTSLAEFWGSAIRIGLPQILLIILVICWLRKKDEAKSGGKGCCWLWSCGWSDDEEEDCSDGSDDRTCTRDRCCRERAGDEGGDDEGGDDGHDEGGDDEEGDNDE